MENFFIAIGLIAAGGILPLLLWRRFTPMKVIAVSIISAGCLLGLIDGAGRLFDPGYTAITWHYAMKPFTLAFRVDTLSAFFLMTIFAICGLASLYSFHYMHSEEKSHRTAVGYLFFSLLIISMAMVVVSNSLIMFMLSWEIMSLSSFFLVIFDYDNEKNRKAGYLYFVFSQIGAMFIFAAFGILYAHTRSFGFDGVADLSHTVKILVFLPAFIGFASKAGVFPFHVWLPHAHPAAPSHISAVMSGVMIKVGIYGIIRIYDILQWPTPVFGYIILFAGIISGILGVVYALGQHDIKRLLAYHSVENIGIILIGIGIGMIGVALENPVMAVFGFSGGLLHVLNHSIFKSLLFMGAGMVALKTGTRTIDALGGLLKGMKITGTTFLIGSLAISGLPPFNGFISEFLVYLGGFNGVVPGKTGFVPCLLAIISLALIGGLALACFTKVVGIVFQGEPRTKAAVDVNETGTTMLIPMVVLATVCIVIGTFPHIFILMAVTGVQSLHPVCSQLSIEPFLDLAGNITRSFALFFAVLLIALFLRKLFYRGKIITRSGTWGCGFTQPTAKMQYTGTSYAASILELFRPVAPIMEDHPPLKGCFPEYSHYHSKVHDIAELHMDRVVVRPVLSLFDKLRWLQHGDIHLYIGYILLAIVVLLFFV